MQNVQMRAYNMAYMQYYEKVDYTIHSSALVDAGKWHSLYKPHFKFTSNIYST